LHLLRTEKIDGAIVVRQGVPTPEEASAVIATTEEELLECAQSVYIPVSTLDALKEIEPKKTYAMTCLPDQAAALRRLQIEGFAPANQVAYVLGPYTGTAMYPAAIRSFLRSHRVSEGDEITSLKWRAGEWPGYLEIETASGRLVRAKKFYYNYLIPFFITRWSLLGMDFANEFCDLSVGDAWSPAFEDKGGGHSVIVTRSEAMESLVREMSAAGELVVESIDPLQASGMHGHMIDFKKRGSYLRGRWRKRFGKGAPDFGLRPRQLPMLRRAVEAVIVVIFFLGRTRLARKIIELIPESVVGPIFNRLRLSWKGMSKPAKRKGLGHLEMDIR
jgi:coenzyme F420 hydrogenase subunit beta